MATLSDYVTVEHLPGFTSTDMSSDKGVYFQQVAEHPQVGRHVRWEVTATMHS